MTPGEQLVADRIKRGLIPGDLDPDVLAEAVLDYDNSFITIQIRLLLEDLQKIGRASQFEALLDADVQGTIEPYLRKHLGARVDEIAHEAYRELKHGRPNPPIR